jgi:hypothetical protein
VPLLTSGGQNPTALAGPCYCSKAWNEAEIERANVCEFLLYAAWSFMSRMAWHSSKIVSTLFLKANSHLHATYRLIL